jgi:LemA protein
VNITLIVIIALIVLLVLIVVGVYNGLVQARNKVDEAWSGIDVQLKRRHDLIPNLIETVKGYASHETEAFESVSSARATAISASGPVAAGKAEGELTQALGRLFAIAEAYPQLRAVESFTQLQAELSNTEDQIAASRRLYNGNVQIFNTKIQQFPGLILAGPFGFGAREFFEIENPVEREPVKVDFSS